PCAEPAPTCVVGRRLASLVPDLTISVTVPDSLALSSAWPTGLGSSSWPTSRTSREVCLIFFFQAEDGIRDATVTGVQTCALPICPPSSSTTYPAFAYILVNFWSGTHKSDVSLGTGIYPNWSHTINMTSKYDWTD